MSGARRFRFRLFVKDEYKPLRVVPPVLWATIIASLVLQVFVHIWQGAAQVSERDLQLSTPPSDSMLRIAAFGDPLPLARILMFNIQAFDNQQGVSLKYSDLDYDLLGLWLDRIVALDEQSEYPHFTASKIYTLVQDNVRQKKMIAWVRRHFREAPNLRWEWMIHTTNFVKYKIEDHELGLEMAREVREFTDPGKVPGWVRQTEVFFLENVSEYESAANLLANLLDAGEVTDPAEFSFLLERLEGIGKKRLEEIENTITRGVDAQEFERLQKEYDQISQRFESVQNKFLQQYDDL